MAQSEYKLKEQEAIEKFKAGDIKEGFELLAESFDELSDVIEDRAYDVKEQGHPEYALYEHAAEVWQQARSTILRIKKSI